METPFPAADDEQPSRVLKSFLRNSAGSANHGNSIPHNSMQDVISDVDLLVADCAERSPAITVVVPVYNEWEVLPQLHGRLAAVLDALPLQSEILYVNDGSTDLSLQVMERLWVADNRVAIVNLSRNFGKEIAITAGLDHVRGEAAVVIDADLQDPPEVIPMMVEKWREGYDVVYATRRERQGETWLKRATATMFYKVMGSMGDVPIPQNTGDFRLLNRRCLDALTTCRERRRFMKGLFAWVGFRQVAINYDRDPRFAGVTKWNYWKLWNFAIEGITSFTIAPLKLATYSGLLTAVGAIVYSIVVIIRTIIWGRQVPGYASLMVAILLLAGVQLIAMGIIGEYVGRIFVEAKGRPLYLLDGYVATRDTQSSRTAQGAHGRPSKADHSPEQRPERRKQ